MPKTISIKVIPNAKKNLVTPFNDGYKVYLTAPPAEGKANKLLLKVLADRLKIKKSRLKIAHGAKSRDKLISID